MDHQLHTGRKARTTSVQNTSHKQPHSLALLLDSAVPAPASPPRRRHKCGASSAPPQGAMHVMRAQPRLPPTLCKPLTRAQSSAQSRGWAGNCVARKMTCSSAAAVLERTTPQPRAPSSTRPTGRAPGRAKPPVHPAVLCSVRSAAVGLRNASAWARMHGASRCIPSRARPRRARRPGPLSHAPRLQLGGPTAAPMAAARARARHFAARVRALRRRRQRRPRGARPPRFTSRCGATTRPRRWPPSPAPLRCAAAGCTWPGAPTWRPSKPSASGHQRHLARRSELAPQPPAASGHRHQSQQALARSAVSGVEPAPPVRPKEGGVMFAALARMRPCQRTHCAAATSGPDPTLCERPHGAGQRRARTGRGRPS